MYTRLQVLERRLLTTNAYTTSSDDYLRRQVVPPLCCRFWTILLMFLYDSAEDLNLGFFLCGKNKTPHLPIYNYGNTALGP